MSRILFVCACFLAGAGCARDQKDAPAAVAGINGEEADRMNATHARFETSEDPPLNAQTYFAAGQLAESRQDAANAIKQYRQALKQDPRHQPSLYRLGVIYTRSKQYPSAIETWQNYILATDNSAAGYSNLGYCLEQAGQYTEAEAAYKKGIIKDPQYRPCRVNYGLMLARQCRTNEATIQLQSVLTPAEVQFNLGCVYEQLGQREGARAAYRKALDCKPDFTEAAKRLKALE